MPFASALSEHPITAYATGEVCGEALEALGTHPDLVLVAYTAPPDSGSREALRVLLQSSSGTTDPEEDAATDPSHRRWLTAVRADAAVIAVLGPICAEKFLAQPDVAAKKVTFAKVDSWKRRDELAKEWITLPGASYPSSDLVDACSAAILKPDVAAAK